MLYFLSSPFVQYFLNHPFTKENLKFYELIGFSKMKELRTGDTLIFDKDFDYQVDLEEILHENISFSVLTFSKDLGSSLKAQTIHKYQPIERILAEILGDSKELIYLMSFLPSSDARGEIIKKNHSLPQAPLTYVDLSYYPESHFDIFMFSRKKSSEKKAFVQSFLHKQSINVIYPLSHYKDSIDPPYIYLESLLETILSFSHVILQSGPIGKGEMDKWCMTQSNRMIYLKQTEDYHEKIIHSIELLNPDKEVQICHYTSNTKI